MDLDFARARRRELRRNGTAAEKLLWSLLRGRQLRGLKFRRQHPVGCYIVDFYCAESGIGVELDGGQHFTPEGSAADQRRDAYLVRRGVRLLRFSNRELFEEVEGVLEVIGRACGR